MEFWAQNIGGFIKMTFLNMGENRGKYRAGNGGKWGFWSWGENLTFVYIFVKNRLYIYEKADFMPTFQF